MTIEGKETLIWVYIISMKMEIIIMIDLYREIGNTYL